MENKRTICISDVHGCGEELQELLNQIQLTEQDELILIGDLFDRAFRADLVWKIIHKYNAVVLLGNHEVKMLKFFLRERETVPIHYTWMFNNLFNETQTVSQSDFSEWIEGLPMLIERNNVLITHAGVNVLNPTEPNISCNVYGNPTPFKNLRSQNWWEMYERDQLVVYGHLVTRDGKPFYYKNKRGKVNSICIDTGVPHGKPLTAYCIETGQVWQYCSGINHFANLKAEMQRNNPRYDLI